MIARLLAVLTLFVTMAVAQPAHAATLTVTASCGVTGYYAPDPANYGTFSCTANASGGNGSYSYQWWVWSWLGGDAYYSSGKTITGNCKWGTLRYFTVYATDTAGSSGSTSATVGCTKP